MVRLGVSPVHSTPDASARRNGTRDGQRTPRRRPASAVYICTMTASNRHESSPVGRGGWDRRSFLAAALGTAAIAPVGAQAPTPQQLSPIPTPRDWSRPEPLQYPDPDIIALDPRFRRYIVANTIIKRL